MKKKKTTTSNLHKTSFIPVYCDVQFARSSVTSNYVKLKNERNLFKKCSVIKTVVYFSVDEQFMHQSANLNRLDLFKKPRELTLQQHFNNAKLHW